MKKTTITFAAVALMLVACKKDKKAEFTATDVTGTTILKGNLTKNIITPNGNGGWSNTTRIPAKDVMVSVTVSKSSLYPNSTAQGADVYTGMTDDKGNYSISVKTNASGVNAKITVDGFTATLDTVVNGKTLTGLLCKFQGINDERTLVMGQNSQLDHHLGYNFVNTNSGSIKTGTAMVTGSLGVSYIKEILTGTLTTLSTTVYVVPSHKVYLSLNNDPQSQSTKQYEATTDALGQYTFVVNTADQGQSGFPQNITVWVNDMISTRDTILLNNTRKTGKMGVYKSQSLNINGVYSNHIRNANYLLYNNFIQN